MAGNHYENAVQVMRTDNGRASAAIPSRSLNRLSARELIRLLELGEISSIDILRDCLARIEEREKTVQAWAHLEPDAAYAEAARIAGRPDRGVLRGIPLGVKDVIDTADMPTAYGSPIYEGHRPAADAAVVAAVRAAGGIVLGKTVTAEFAHRYPGPTTHPLDPSRTPGGSSSGSAACVADFMVPLALGTQTTASTVRPASYCGVVGYRPSYGLVSCWGIKPSAGSFDTVGVFARDIPDCTLLRDILLGIEPRPVQLSDNAPRIGFCRTILWPMVEPAAAARIEAAVSRLAAGGAPVIDVDLPSVFEPVASAHRVISSYELARNLVAERLFHADQLSPLLKEGKMAEGLRYGMPDYFAAVKQLEAARMAVDGVFASFDILITPGTTGIAPVGTASTGTSDFGAIWTALHLPSMSVPLPDRLEGMPLGVQLVTPRGEDIKLGDMALWIANKWR